MTWEAKKSFYFLFSGTDGWMDGWEDHKEELYLGTEPGRRLPTGVAGLLLMVTRGSALAIRGEKASKAKWRFSAGQALLVAVVAVVVVRLAWDCLSLLLYESIYPPHCESGFHWHKFKLFFFLLCKLPPMPCMRANCLDRVMAKLSLSPRQWGKSIDVRPAVRGAGPTPPKTGLIFFFFFFFGKETVACFHSQWSVHSAVAR